MLIFFKFIYDVLLINPAYFISNTISFKKQVSIHILFITVDSTGISIAIKKIILLYL